MQVIPLVARARTRAQLTCVVPCVLLTLLLAALPTMAQPSVPRATTVSGLMFHAAFYHGQRVAVRGRLLTETSGTWVDGGDDMVRVVGDVDASS